MANKMHSKNRDGEHPRRLGKHTRQHDSAQLGPSVERKESGRWSQRGDDAEMPPLSVQEGATKRPKGKA